MIYVDCSLQVPNSVFSQITVALFNYYSVAWRQLESFVRARVGSRVVGNTKAAISCMPYMGGLLNSTGMQEPPGSNFTMSHFSSAVAELICEFLASLGAKFLFLFDNAQDIDDWSLDLLHTTVGRTYCQFQYVLALVQRPGLEPVSRNALITRDLREEYEIFHLSFPAPTIPLGCEIANLYGMQVSDIEVAQLLEEASENIYKLLSLIEIKASANGYLNHKNEDPELPFSPTEEEIIRLLSIAKQSIRRSDLLAICLKGDLVLVDHEYEVDFAIEHLEKAGILAVSDLPDGDYLVSLASKPSGVEKLVSKSFELVTTDRLYRYFLTAYVESKRHSSSEIVPLLYRLSKKVDPENTGRLIQAILSISLQMGSASAAERFIRGVTLENHKSELNYSDFIVRVLFYLSMRDFKKSLTLIEEHSGANWMQSRFVKILYAISLNRSRHHEAADALIEKLLESTKSKEEAVLLAAYKIAGLLHMNNVEGACRFFESIKLKTEGAENFGYILRNAASAVSWESAFDLLTEAMGIFLAQNDRFGFATSLSNRATAYFYLGNPERALHDAKEAYRLLEVYGIHHLHVATNNMGVIHAFKGDYREAEKLLWRAISVAKATMPIIFSKINLAAAYLLDGRQEESLRLIRDLALEAESNPVDRVRQKYYVNAALIEASSGSPLSRVADLCAKARAYPDRKDKRQTTHRVDWILACTSQRQEIDRQEFWNLYLPCTLSYWYQNPIEGLPTNFLAAEAEIQNS